MSGGTVAPTAETVERDVVRDTYSKVPPLIGAADYTISLPVELKGGGVSGSVIVEPEISKLLQLCGLQMENAVVVTVASATGFVVGETVTNTTQINSAGRIIEVDTVNNRLFLRAPAADPVAADSLTGDTSSTTSAVSAVADALSYRPVTDRDTQKTASIRYNTGGVRHLATGCRGNLRLECNNGQFGRFTFDIRGAYNNPTDVPIGSATVQATVPPRWLNVQTRIGAWSMATTAIQAFSVDLGNEINPREDYKSVEGRIGFELTNRRVTGGINPEAVLLADYDAFTIWKASTSQPISHIFGANPGERWLIMLPEATYTALPYADRNGIRVYDFALAANSTSTASDDEISLVCF